MGLENRGPQVEGVAILFLTLSWVFVTLRCYVRAVLMKGFGMDDWLAIAALVSPLPISLFKDLGCSAYLGVFI